MTTHRQTTHNDKACMQRDAIEYCGLWSGARHVGGQQTRWPDDEYP